MRASLLQRLPYPDLMRRRLRTFAMHDAIVAPRSRSFEFHPRWARGQQMGAFKDGEGNAFFAWFTAQGAVVRGFDHDSAMSPFRHDPPARWPGLFDGLPAALAHAQVEPAFVPDEITFACWATGGEGEWRTGPVVPPRGKDADGSARLLACFNANFERWRKAYYATRSSPGFDVLWWGKDPLTPEVVFGLNADADLKEVRAEAVLLGWKTVGLEGRVVKPSAKPGTAKPVKVKPTAKPATGKPVTVKPTAKPATAKPATATPARSFGAAEFVVRCEPTRVRMLIHGKTVVAEAKVDVYLELFELVQARLAVARRTGA
jgi:hypothetical protein